MSHVVEGRVVVRRRADDREVQPGETGVAQHREVGVVREQLVDVVGQRVGDRGMAPEQSHERGVARPGLEHDDRSGGAARLQVEHHGVRLVADVGRLHERGRAQLAGLLAVGEQHVHVVARAVQREDAHDLEDRRHRHRVVGGARAGRHRVVVRHEQETAGRGGAGEMGVDVVGLTGDREGAEIAG